MLLTRLLAVAVSAAAIATSAQAAIVDLTFSDTPGDTAAFQISGNTSVYLGYQLSIRDATDDNDYDFHFTYDTEAVGPNYGAALVSGRIGGFTDFSGFTTTMSYAPLNRLQINLFRSEPAGSGVYGTLFIFELIDDDGDLGASLPTSIDPTDLDAATASFNLTRSGSGVGGGYWRAYYGDATGTVASTTGSGDPTGGGSGGSTGAVPEPATWAMMILGFGAAGGLLRRRGRAYAASNCSAASRA